MREEKCTNEWITEITEIVFYLFAVRGLCSPPRITADQEEMIVQSNDTLMLVCEADSPVEWRLPTFLEVPFCFECSFMNQ